MKYSFTKSPLLIWALALILGLGGCDLSSYNENPNEPTAGNPDAILAKAERDLASNTHGDGIMSNMNLNAQYTTQNQYTDRYGGVSYEWGSFYTTLNDLQEVKRLSDQSNSAAPENIEAVATIIQAWAFQILTDVYGDIPFEEALQGAENRSPSYTAQENIYPALIDSLDQAIGKISVGSGGPRSDLIHGGDMEKWKRFANGLKMRIGIRAVDANRDLAERAITEANGNALQSNEDNTYFQFSTSSAHRSSYHDNRVVLGRDDYDVSERFVDAMGQYDVNDPRMDAYFEQTSSTTAPCEDGSGSYKGFPFEREQQSATELKNVTNTCEYSRPETFWPSGPSGDGDAYKPMMYYDEILITKAEAAARGIINGNPKDYLKQAIEASVNFYGEVVPGADIEADDPETQKYIDAVQSDYDRSNFEQVIGEQRWFAFYMNDVQGWSTFRRLDFQGWHGPPVGGVANDFGTFIPLRAGYPSSEQQLNGTNYESAVERQFGGVSGDDAGSYIWWDEEGSLIPESARYQPEN